MARRLMPNPSPYRRFLCDKIETMVGSNAEGVEVGVMKGKTSQCLLEYISGSVVHMVDPWCQTAYSDRSDPNSRLTDAELTACENEAEQRVSQWIASGRAKIWKCRSEHAAHRFEDDTLDFVFLDGDHSPEAVTMDSVRWWAKLKPGGLMFWHDYGNNQGEWTMGVQKAVDDFVESVGVSVAVEPQLVLAWTVKPRTQTAKGSNGKMSRKTKRQPKSDDS